MDTAALLFFFSTWGKPLRVAPPPLEDSVVGVCPCRAALTSACQNSCSLMVGGPLATNTGVNIELLVKGGGGGG